MSTVLGIAAVVWLDWSLVLVSAQVTSIYCMFHEAPTLDLWWRAGARLHQELWILVAPCILLTAVDDWHARVWKVPLDAFGLLVWWNVRDWPDENRWRRRGRKLREAVTRRGARLVVVPQ